MHDNNYASDYLLKIAVKQTLYHNTIINFNLSSDLTYVNQLDFLRRDELQSGSKILHHLYFLTRVFIIASDTSRSGQLVQQFNEHQSIHQVCFETLDL